MVCYLRGLKGRQFLTSQHQNHKEKELVQAVQLMDVSGWTCNDRSVLMPGSWRQDTEGERAGQASTQVLTGTMLTTIHWAPSGARLVLNP